MKIKLSNILIAIALTIFSCLFGLKYNKFGTNKNTETYLGLPVYTAFNSKIYDTSTIFNAIKYSLYYIRVCKSKTYLILKNITKTYLNLFIFMVKLTIVK